MESPQKRMVILDCLSVALVARIYQLMNARKIKIHHQHASGMVKMLPLKNLSHFSVITFLKNELSGISG